MSFTTQNIHVLNNFQLDSGLINTTTGVLTLPSTTTTIVGTNTSDTLTNKVINDASNTVGANILRNGNVYVLNMSGAAPTTGQVLTYVGANNLAFTTSSNSLVVGTATTASSIPTTLASIPVPIGSVAFIRTDVVASSGGPGATVGYASVLKATFQNAGGLITFSGGPTMIMTEQFYDPAMSTITASYVISGGNVTVSVTGLPAGTVAFRSYSEVRTSP